MTPKGTNLAKLPSAELAGHLFEHHRVHRTGHKYAAAGPLLPDKVKARARILGMFKRAAWDRSLSIVTMPGLWWYLEWALLRCRESPARIKTDSRVPRRTHITAIEADEAIYRVSMKHIPGGGESIQSRDAPGYATASVRTRLISRYHRCLFEGLAYSDEPPVDAAWLDFNGPLMESRIDALAAFWPRVRSIMVVTCMNGRSPYTPEDLGKRLAGGRCRDVYRYADTCPMWQATYVRNSSTL